MVRKSAQSTDVDGMIRVMVEYLAETEEALERSGSDLQLLVELNDDLSKAAGQLQDPQGIGGLETSQNAQDGLGIASATEEMFQNIQAQLEYSERRLHAIREALDIVLASMAEPCED